MPTDLEIRAERERGVQRQYAYHTFWFERPEGQAIIAAAELAGEQRLRA